MFALAASLFAGTRNPGASGAPAGRRLFMGARTLIEHDTEGWDEVIARIPEAIRARD